MFRKILFLCLTLFAFSAINAQNITSTQTSCGNDDVFEPDPSTPIVNGKNAYRRTAGSGDNSVGIQYTGTRWVFFYQTALGNTPADPADVVFYNDFSAGAKAPDVGWLPNSTGPCSSGVMSLSDGGSGVLSVDKDIYSKMALYPNPSNGFIQISNLDAPSRVVITNITGQIVKDVKVDINNNRIDIQELSKGFYFVEIEGKKTIKLIKQ